MTDPAARVLFALARVDALVRDGVPTAAALRSASLACGVDGVDLALRWHVREAAAVEARRALERPTPTERRKTK